MSIQEEKALVAKITCKDSVYYITDRYGISLDGTTYLNVVVGWGSASYKGNFGEGFQVGDFSIALANGERFIDNGYALDPTEIWNNNPVEIKYWHTGITTFSGCTPFLKGIIKDFNISSQTSIDLTVDVTDTRDNKLLPSILIEDQSNLTTTTEYERSISGYSTSAVLLTTNADIFEPGEMVILKNDYGEYEYHSVNKIESGNILYFNSDLVYTYTGVNGGVVQKPFRNAPKSSIGKTVPIQIGELGITDDEYKNGIFGKCITINEKVGEQYIVADGVELNDLYQIGVWDNSANRFFIGRQEIDDTTLLSQNASSGQNVVKVNNPAMYRKGMAIKIADDLSEEIRIIDDTSTIDINSITLTENLTNSYTTANNAYINFHTGEYQVSNNNNSILFQINSIAVLGTLLTDSTDIDLIQLGTGEAKYIIWQNEDSWNSSVSKNAELLNPSIIRIDNELMLVVEEPDLVNDRIYVERGYSGSVKTSHSIGTEIYQSSEFSSKNLIVFRDRFDAVGVANQYIGARDASNGNTTPSTYIADNYTNMLDGNESTKFEYSQVMNQISNTFDWSWLTFDIKFKKVEEDYSVISAIMACKMTGETTGSWSAPSPGMVMHAYLMGLDSGKYSDQPTSTNFGTLALFYVAANTSATTNYTMNTWETFEDDSHQGGIQLIDKEYNSIPGTELYITTLKDLNRRWKIALNLIASIGLGSVPDFSVPYNFKIYNIGVWLDFVVDFSKRNIMAPIQGRKINSDVISICGDDSPTRLDGLCENPVDVLALLLTQELGYESSEFTANWETVRDYYINGSNFGSVTGTTPKCAFSYGIDDDRKEGWQLCEDIASHFNLSILKSYDGKIDIVNLHEIYYNTPSGSEINIDDILFLVDSGERRLRVWQTGSDLLYNECSLKWKRNNSSNEYQEVYKTEKTLTLESGNSLEDARIDYYQGKVKTLEIESPYIYSSDDAQRKAEWEVNDKAEAHFWIEFFIDASHYLEKQSPPLSEQYKIGDIIYLTGNHGGIKFQTTNKFYIQDVLLHDSGREIEIHAKSLQQVTDFENTAVESGYQYQDNGGDSFTGSVWNDNGGDSFAGTKYQDNGG